MYNRYIRNEHGEYTRVSEERPHHSSYTADHTASQQTHKEHTASAPSPPKQTKEQKTDSLTALLQHLLDRLHLDHVDTGDLMLLALLFFLFQEKADEELLVALGLLLIL